MTSVPTVDIVTVTYNSPRLPVEFQQLVDTPGFQLLVIDNGSSSVVPDLPRGAHLINNNRNLGFGAACNQALHIGGAPYLLFLNPDCQIDPGGVMNLLDHARTEGMGDVIIGPRAEGGATQRTLPAGSAPGCRAFLRQYSGLARRLGGGFNAYSSSTPAGPVEVDWVGGGCMLLSRDLFQRLNGFNTDFFLYGEDVDLCLRAKDRGARVVLAGDVSARHLQGTGSPATVHLRMAWLRNLRRIVEGRQGRMARWRLDVALFFGGAQVSLLRLIGRKPTIGRPDLVMLHRHVWISSDGAGV